MRVLDKIIDLLCGLRRRLWAAADGFQAWWQRATVGYAYIEVWCFPEYLAAWALPRLRHLQEHGCGICIGNTAAEHDAALADIIYALDLKVRDQLGRGPELTETEAQDMWDDAGRYARGCRLFREHWRALWD